MIGSIGVPQLLATTQFVLVKGQAGLDPLVSLTPVTKPHPHHLLVEAQCCRHATDVVTTGFGLTEEVLLQGFLGERADGGATFTATVGGTWTRRDR